MSAKSILPWLIGCAAASWLACIDPVCPEGHSRDGDVCLALGRDASAAVAPDCEPDGDERCDGLDNDCDGDIDEDLDDLTMFRDEDGDGVGTGEGQLGCRPDFSTVDGDCNDRDPAIYPGASEVCNGLDDDCDGEADEGMQVRVYRDADGDGHGDGSAEGMAVCPNAVPAEFVELNDDCDDACPTCFPGDHNEDTCDGHDDDCDGEIDEGLLREFALDCDGDGFLPAEPVLTAARCAPPAELPASCAEGAWWPPEMTSQNDCSDSDFEVRPDVEELCGDGIDNDCDGEIDPDGCIQPADAAEGP